MSGILLESLYLAFVILYSLSMSFTIISVTGAHSSAGKTTLCSILLEHLQDFGAIKFTKTPLFTSVIDDEAVIMQDDKDTAIMARSGARKVVWVKSSGRELGDALDIAMSKMDGLKGVVVEGNSPARHLSPHLIIFIVGEDGNIKESASDMIERAHIMVLNSAGDRERPSFLNSASQKNVPVFRIDLIKKEGEIDKFLSYAKKYIKE